MDKPAILMVGNYLPLEKYNKNVWQQLSERLLISGWDVRTTSSKINRVVRLLDMVWSVLRYQKHYDIAQVDVFSGKAFIYAEIVSALLVFLKKPFVLTLHGGGLPKLANQNPQRMAKLLKRANIVVTPSPYHQTELAKFRPDIRLIPNPIDLRAYNYRWRPKPQPKLVWLRAFHDIYNPSMVVSVLGDLACDYPQVHCFMVGPDKGDGSKQAMLSLADRLGVRKHLTLTGGVPHNQISTWLDQGDIYLNTTNFDTSPLSVIEALASGMCVVSTNVGGIPHLVRHEHEALLVSSNDATAMATEIRRLLADHTLAGKLSKNGRKKAESLDWSNIFPLWEDLFEDVIKKHYG